MGVWFWICAVTAVDSGRRALQYLGLDEEIQKKETNGFDVSTNNNCNFFTKFPRYWFFWAHALAFFYSGFQGLKVDLIITDYCMPGMTGYELLKKVKESSAFREIPVVIMSSENVIARIDRYCFFKQLLWPWIIEKNWVKKIDGSGNCWWTDA